MVDFDDFVEGQRNIAPDPEPEGPPPLWLWLLIALGVIMIAFGIFGCVPHA